MDVRRLDKLEQSITRSSDQAATLSYALQACQQTVVNRAFRQEVGPAGRTLWGLHSPEMVLCNQHAGQPRILCPHPALGLEMIP